ncbi:MAG: hypothetical protein Q4Q58_06390 [Thermoplasmata archaeon]|nr:hypothetical protein [Thermoplasmata archaeon]
MSPEEKDMVSVTLEVPREYCEKMAAEGVDPKERILELIQADAGMVDYDEGYELYGDIVRGILECTMEKAAPILGKMIMDDFMTSLSMGRTPCTVNLRMDFPADEAAQNESSDYFTEIGEKLESMPAEPLRDTRIRMSVIEK